MLPGGSFIISSPKALNEGPCPKELLTMSLLASFMGVPMMQINEFIHHCSLIVAIVAGQAYVRIYNDKVCT